MPLDKKFTLFSKGVNKIVSIMGQSVDDLSKCTIVGDDADVIQKWFHTHASMTADYATISKNLTKHIFGMVSNILGAIGDINNKKWYNFGKDIGQVANRLLVDDKAK